MPVTSDVAESSGGHVGSWFGDVYVSMRQLAKAPGFTLSATIVLALGIGLNAAMFSAVYAFIFKERPYERPEQLVQLYSSQANRPDSYRAFSYPAYRELAAETTLFAGILAHARTIVGVKEGGQSRRTFAELISRNYFDVLGVSVLHGRGFTAEEDRIGQNVPVVVATYDYWKRTGFSPDLVGSTIRINERPFTVVGITPRGFTGTSMVFGPELFLPLGVFDSIENPSGSRALRPGQAQRTIDRADAYILFLVARLTDEVTLGTASDRLALIGPRLAQAFPAEYEDARVTLGPLARFPSGAAPSNESVLGMLGSVLLGLTGAVLLTVCLNLASLLMARGRARRKEFAIRLALGGGRARIVRQLLTEGLMLSLAGGIGGALLGQLALDALSGTLTAALPFSIVLRATNSQAIVAATALFCLLATISFALGPALRHSRPDVFADLKPQAGEDVPDRHRRFMPRNPLLVAQVSLSLSLLIAAGLFVRMVQKATVVEFGFRADHTVLAEVDGGLAGYTMPQTLDLYASIERRLASLPGVESASVAALVPLGTDDTAQMVRRAGINVPAGVRPQSPEDGQAFRAPWNTVSGSYFNAMGVPLLQGRTFTELESFSAGGPGVAMIDDTLARKLWPDGSALGQRIEFVPREETTSRPAPTYEVIGVVGSTARQLFEDELPGSVFVPFGVGERPNAYFHVRPRSAQASLSDVVRDEIRAAAPGLPLFSTKTYQSHITTSIEYRGLQLSAALFAAFGALAMVVALVGIYGAMSYSVARRTREIGIRMAVGATARDVRGMILGEGLTVTLLGVGIGWILGLGVGRMLASIFVDVAAFDVVTFVVTPVGLAAAATIAVWWPARRATRLNPVTALRSE
jgi:predicted permease